MGARGYSILVTGLALVAAGCGDARSAATAPPPSLTAVPIQAGQQPWNYFQAVTTTIQKVVVPSATLEVNSPTETSILVEQHLQLYGPDAAFSVQLPRGFEQLGDPNEVGGLADRPDFSLKSVLFVNKELRQRITVSITRGEGEATRLQPDVEQLLWRELTGIRPEGVVYMWTDPLTQERGMAWAVDVRSVIWVYAVGLEDEQMVNIALTIKVPVS